MIPRHVSDAITAKFPGVKLMERDGLFIYGFGVQYRGSRNGWVITDTEDCWRRVTDAALNWLETVHGPSQV